MAYVHLHGYLGRDPELRSLGESSCCQFSLADKAYLKPKSGELEAPPQWYRVELWGRRAEALSRLLNKGKEVVVHGQLDLASYTKADGSIGLMPTVKQAEVTLVGKAAEASAPRSPNPLAPAALPSGLF